MVNMQTNIQIKVVPINISLQAIFSGSAGWAAVYYYW